jgi:hypothetical protein
MKNAGDCGCGGHALDLEAASLGEPLGEPDVQALDQALTALASEAEDLTLDVAGLEGALDEAEADMSFAAATDAGDLPSLGNVLAIAERYPGLKITFSF